MADPLLLDGLNHVGLLTKDTARLVAFYEEVFGAEVLARTEPPFGTLTIIDVGGGRELNVFEIPGNAEADRQVPMFGRGRLDHLALQAASVEAFDEARRRLMGRGASDGFVTDFGPVYSLFFVDPDGLECEVVMPNPNGSSSELHPPGTPAPGYEVGVP
jgi:catechol 2,3-dioxygenase-like lactoylglutathione lyase family enzyme